MTRQWAMTKLAPGDWTCPSNDTSRIWRFMRNEPNTYDADGHPLDGTWRVYSIDRTALEHHLEAWWSGGTDADGEGWEVDPLEELALWDLEVRSVPTRRDALAVMEAAQ